MHADTANIEPLLKHAAWLRRMAKALIHDPDMADDVVQATLVSAWQRPSTGLIHERAWLGRVAINQARDLLRGEKRRKSREQAIQVGAPKSVPGPDALLGEIAIHCTVAEVVSVLAEPHVAGHRNRVLRGLSRLRG